MASCYPPHVRVVVLLLRLGRRNERDKLRRAQEKQTIKNKQSLSSIIIIVMIHL